MSKRTSLHAGTLPYWTDSASLPAFPRIARDAEVDVVVVGGGITGLTAAYSARKHRPDGRRARTRQVRADRYRPYHRAPDDGDGRAADASWRAGSDGPRPGGLGRGTRRDRTDRFHLRDHEIDCAFEWVDGYLHAPRRRDGRQPRRSRSKKPRSRAISGFDAAFVRDVPICGEPGYPVRGSGALSPAQVSGGPRPGDPCGGRAHLRAQRGRRVLQGTARRQSQRLHADAATTSSSRPTIRSSGVAGMASATLFQTKLALYTSYVVAGRVPRGTVPDALFWDTADPYHYLRIEPHRDARPGHLRRRGSQDGTGLGHRRVLRASGARPRDQMLPRFE